MPEMARHWKESVKIITLCLVLQIALFKIIIIIIIIYLESVENGF